MNQKNKILAVGFIKTHKSEMVMTDMARIINQYLPKDVTERPRILFDNGFECDLDRKAIDTLLVHLICPKVKYLIIRRITDITPDMEQARHFIENLDKYGVNVIVLNDEMKCMLADGLNETISMIREMPFTEEDKQYEKK